MYCSEGQFIAKVCINEKDCTIDSHIASRKFQKISFDLEINEIRKNSKIIVPL